MKKFKCVSALGLIFILGNIRAAHADTEIDGSAMTSSSFTFTGLVSISSLTANNISASSLNVSTITAVSSATITNATIIGSLNSGNMTVNGNITFAPTTDGIVGTTTNDDAITGNVGQCVNSVVAGISIGASSSYQVVTSIPLTPGDWDVSGAIVVQPFTSPSGPNTLQITTDSTGSSGSPGDNMNYFITSNSFSTGQSVPKVRFSLNSTTTIYLLSSFTYSSGSPTMWGSLKARRVR